MSANRLGALSCHLPLTAQSLTCTCGLCPGPCQQPGELWVPVHQGWDEQASLSASSRASWVSGAEAAEPGNYENLHEANTGDETRQRHMGVGWVDAGRAQRV